jgi:hypothetical protein
MPKPKTRSNVLAFPEPSVQHIGHEVESFDLCEHITSVAGQLIAYQGSGDNIQFLNAKTGRLEWLLIRTLEVQNA